MLHELDDGRFELNELGEHLRSDHPQSAAGWAAFVGRPDVWAAWGALDHTVASGENAFTHVHGEDVWTYRARRPEESAAFDRAMVSQTRGVTESVLEVDDFSRFGTIIDVAGGTGRSWLRSWIVTPRHAGSSSTSRTSSPASSCPSGARWLAATSSRPYPRAATPTS